MPTPEYHAELSPSSAHRWINCPASVRLSAGIAKTTSKYAEAGRLAHAIAELKARKRFTPMSKRTYQARIKQLQDDPFYDPGMEAGTDAYVDELEAHAMTFQAAPFTALETPVPIGLYTGETKEDGSPATGTADCIQIAEGVLWINDYKNGTGVAVDAGHNPQMMTYALGAMALYAPVYGNTLHTVKMTIIQPNLGAPSTWETGADALLEWGRGVLTPAAEKAVSDDPGDPRPGDWCKFCPARHTCRSRAEKNLALEAFGKALPAGVPDAVQKSPAPLLTDAEVGGILTRGERLVSWYNDLKDYALAACLAGKTIPGYKAVEGRSSRVWADPDAAFAGLQAAGVAEAMLYERKPVTPPALEKALGKKAFADVAASYVGTSSGKPTLVPESDKRKPYNAAAIAFGEAGAE